MSPSNSLLFISPRFLFPVDSGGKIRTTQILRGMKNGNFKITLVSPAPTGGPERYQSELASICDHFSCWPESRGNRFRWLQRIRYALSRYPIPVATDQSMRGRAIVARCLASNPDLTIFDFPHSTVLGQRICKSNHAIFTHNVETEIFERHAQNSTGIRSRIWRNQQRKMSLFENDSLTAADGVIAVSARDADTFADRFNVQEIDVIQTGVDLEYFQFCRPEKNGRIVFTGAMDWLANIDAMQWFKNEVWPGIAKTAPSSTMTIVGRAPPRDLVLRTAAEKLPWFFTGLVDDVRSYVRDAAVFVIPLRVGGGTRLKVFEAMSMGCPVVSTTIGVEGLDVVDGKHYLNADEPADFAAKVARLLSDEQLRSRIAESARAYVEENCSFQTVAKEFEKICTNIMNRPHRL